MCTLWKSLPRSSANPSAGCRLKQRPSQGMLSTPTRLLAEHRQGEPGQSPPTKLNFRHYTVVIKPIRPVAGSYTVLHRLKMTEPLVHRKVTLWAISHLSHPPLLPLNYPTAHSKQGLGYPPSNKCSIL
jgi:hypothetical protein